MAGKLGNVVSEEQATGAAVERPKPGDDPRLTIAPEDDWFLQWIRGGRELPPWKRKGPNAKEALIRKYCSGTK